MCDQAVDRTCVAHYKTLELPCVSQNVMQKPTIAACRNIIQVHIGAHDGPGACIDRCFEWRQIYVPHQLFRNVRRVIVAPAICSAVPSEMFHTCQYVVRPADLWALEPEHLRAGHGCSQVRIFSCAFHHATPASVASNVHHRAESPCNACGPGFSCGHTLRSFHHLWVPRGSHRDRVRKNRVIPVDHIEPEQNRNVKARLVHGNVLPAVDLLGIGDPQYGSRAVLASDLFGHYPILLLELRNWESG